MLASAAVNLGMASMSLSNKQNNAPPALPNRPPVGRDTLKTPSPTIKPNPAVISSSAKHVPPPLPSRPPKGSLASLESTSSDDGEFLYL